jgi:N-acetylmuramoyl-L-alanine amidase
MQGIIDFTADDLDTMTRTLWGECRGEADLGRAAVAWVIRNRAAWPKPAWWGHKVTDVCCKPSQFSCWNDDDPNLAKVEKLSPEDPAYRTLHLIATRVLTGKIADPTAGATHYRRIGTEAEWAKGRTPTATIGTHEFFRIGPGA